MDRRTKHPEFNEQRRCGLCPVCKKRGLDCRCHKHPEQMKQMQRHYLQELRDVAKGAIRDVIAAEKQYGIQGESIQVTWGWHDEPVVELPEFLKQVPVQLMERQVDLNDSLLLDYKGVKVYWAIRDEDENHNISYSQKFVTTTPLVSYEDQPAFSLEKLPEIPKRSQRKYGKLFQGDEHGDAKRILAYLINTGKLTQDGLKL